MSNHKATFGQWVDVKCSHKEDSHSACILELRARVEALEAQAGNLKGSLTSSTPPPVATDEELRAIWMNDDRAINRLRNAYDLGVAHGQAASREVAEPAPVAGGLVERVSRVIGMGEGGDWSPEARAAILEVAPWLREQGWKEAADLLEQEAGQ